MATNDYGQILNGRARRNRVHRRSHVPGFGTARQELLQRIKEVLSADITAPIMRTKLMFVGMEGVGKTSLVKRLLSGSFEKKQTSTKGLDLTLSTLEVTNRKREWKKGKSSVDPFMSHLNQVLTLSRTSESLTRRRAQNMLQFEEHQIQSYGQRFLTLGGNAHDNLNLGFTIFDFGGQEVFYNLHHLFLNEFGVYIVVFNTRELLKEVRRQRSTQKQYLKFWLNSKRLHAPKAPVVLVGTFSTGYSADDIQEASDLVEEVVKSTRSYQVQYFHDTDRYIQRNFYSCFFPIDNKTKMGIPPLKKEIEEIMLNDENMKDEVNLNVLRIYDTLMQTKKEYLSFHEVEKILIHRKILTLRLEDILTFLSHRGLILYFHLIETLENYVILEPNWVINAITSVVWDVKTYDNLHLSMENMSSFNEYSLTGVLPSQLLEAIWLSAGYDKEIQSFLRKLMIFSLLLCKYSFARKKSYYVPSCIPRKISVKLPPQQVSQFRGPYFVLDFSGDFVKSSYEKVNFLPAGVFEKLLCILVEHSACFEESFEPKIAHHRAILSFGPELLFLMYIEYNVKSERASIIFRTMRNTSPEATISLAQQVSSMLLRLQEEFFTLAVSNQSLWSCVLVVPSSKRTGYVLASFDALYEKFKSSDYWDDTFRPHRASHIFVTLADYKDWLPNRELERFSLKKKSLADSARGLVNDPVFFPHRRKHVYLPSSCHYHCFLSYRQEDSIDLVGRLHDQLQSMGFRCWYDQEYAGQYGLNLEAMQEGVKQSMAYILILSENIFKSSYVVEEFKAALEYERDIIFLHHPNTGSNFGHYIQAAPEIIKAAFRVVESIPIRRRKHEKIAFLKKLEKELHRIGQSYYQFERKG
eukprot:augustus_masked-scaffold_5-processed-gene-12.2-mRNA-1 protein AED:0.46 eAED:0.46 QI:0/-1/0/1/-1/1/1/0/863